MKAVATMTNEELVAEARRRDDRRRKGLPFDETTEEAEKREREEDTRLEKEIQLEVMKIYRAHGCVVYNLSQARASKQSPGLGDLYVFWEGMSGLGPLAWWHETKTPSGEASPAQREFARFCEHCHVTYVIGGVLAAERHLQRIGAWTL